MTWDFSGGNAIVGAYGNQSERGIERLGFITLDTACQYKIEENIEEAEEEKCNTEEDEIVVFDKVEESSEKEQKGQEIS